VSIGSPTLTEETRKAFGEAFEKHCAEPRPIVRVVPDQLHFALGAVLSDYHWRSFCDAWLAIGFAACLCSHGYMGEHPLKPRDLEKRIGRVRHKKFKR
jgi:hypothetical protein